MTVQFKPYRKKRISHIIKGILSLLYAGSIVHLVRYGHLSLYVESRLLIPVKLAAIGLILIAGAQLWIALTIHRPAALICECCADDAGQAGEGQSRFLLYGLLLLPLLFGYVLPDSPGAGDVHDHERHAIPFSTHEDKD
ncbi:DUF1980 domain-containing protein [Gorillibacterium sp. CAU 1737]|uniref:DUF1980 domain-containing protein n=1 Tax=Gorillibacterium sp. CAU 1737 TaxID=3140362 RepID=UPI003261AB82